MRKLYEFFKVLQFQKGIIAAATTYMRKYGKGVGTICFAVRIPRKTENYYTIVKYDLIHNPLPRTRMSIINIFFGISWQISYYSIILCRTFQCEQVHYRWPVKNMYWINNCSKGIVFNVFIFLSALPVLAKKKEQNIDPFRYHHSTLCSHDS